ncbi:hypothetical protein ACN4EK_09325 [Pantanalinema rosaneae CENA516]|uniref:hypothetical protein n=1 Tax=Pantanalinema rosaneae TaxID=1620701 RepID=UPI003D6FAF29
MDKLYLTITLGTEVHHKCKDSVHIEVESGSEPAIAAVGSPNYRWISNYRSRQSPP